MKKVIKLTESDLYRIIKRVISEQDPPTGSSTTTTTTQRPTQLRRLKDYNWYQTELMKIVQNFLSAMNFNMLVDFSNDNDLLNNPNIKKQFEMYAKQVGDLVYPSSSESDKIKMGSNYLKYISFKPETRLIKKGDSSSIKAKNLTFYAPENFKSQIDSLVKMKQPVT